MLKEDGILYNFVLDMLVPSSSELHFFKMVHFQFSISVVCKILVYAICKSCRSVFVGHCN